MRLSDDFDAVRRAISRREIDDKSASNASPTGFFAMPFDATTGIGKLFSIEQSATCPDYSIGKVTTGA